MKNDITLFKVNELVKVHSVPSGRKDGLMLSSLTPGRIISSDCEAGIALLFKGEQYDIQTFTISQYVT